MKYKNYDQKSTFFLSNSKCSFIFCLSYEIEASETNDFLFIQIDVAYKISPVSLQILNVVRLFRLTSI